MSLRLAVLAALCLASTVHADVRITELTGPDEPIPPEHSAFLAMSIEADCTSLLARLLPGSTTPIAAKVQWSTQGDLYVIGQEQIHVSVEPCMAGSHVAGANATFQLTASITTPAFRPFTVNAIVSLDDVQGIEGLPLDSANDTASLNATAEANLVSILDVPVKNQACSCAEITYDVTVRNLGNARTTYAFDVTRPPGHPKGWNIRLPDELTLESPFDATSGSSATVAIIVLTPKAAWDIGTYQITVQPRAEEDGSLGAPLTVNLLASNPDAKPRYASTPAPSTLLPIVLMAAALRLRRR